MRIKAGKIKITNTKLKQSFGKLHYKYDDNILRYAIIIKRSAFLPKNF